MFKVRLSDKAKRFYEAADHPLTKKLVKAFDQLEQDPRESNNSKKLSGMLVGYWRYRVGDHRIVYHINEGKRIVEIVYIAHRRDVYD